MVRMALAIESPFGHDVTAGISQGTTPEMGRLKRRINNDPYGGEGYLWDEVVSDRHHDNDLISLGTSGNGTSVDLLSEPTVVHASGERLSAVQRLDQLRQHLIDLVGPALTATPEQKCFEGLSLDNIHLGIGALQEWRSPHWAEQRDLCYPQPRQQFNQEWQQYAHHKLFGPHSQQYPLPRDSRHQHMISAQHYNTPYADPDVRDSLREPANGKGENISIRAFEPIDVHCNSWSSCLAHRRREIAAIA